MKITKIQNPENILHELGSRLVRNRISLNMTQAQLAEKSGVSKRTIERFESGGDIHLSTLIRILRVVGRVELLDELLPSAQLSPMELLAIQDRQGKPRKRVSGKRKVKVNRPWKWKEE